MRANDQKEKLGGSWSLEWIHLCNRRKRGHFKSHKSEQIRLRRTVSSNKVAVNFTSDQWSVWFNFRSRYDPNTNQWTLISNISKPREAIALTSLGSSCLFVAGGYDGMRFRNECERYDPVKNEWTKVSCLMFVKLTLQSS